MSVLNQVFKFRVPWKDNVETETMGSVSKKIYETPGIRRTVSGFEGLNLAPAWGANFTVKS